MLVRMCVCVHIYIYVYMHSCMYACMHVYVCINVSPHHNLPAGTQHQVSFPSHTYPHTCIHTQTKISHLCSTCGPVSSSWHKTSLFFFPCFFRTCSDSDTSSLHVELLDGSILCNLARSSCFVYVMYRHV